MVGGLHIDNMVQYNIRISSEMRQRLELIPKGQRTGFVREAIEASLSYEDQSIARLDREIKETEQILNVKRQLRDKKIRDNEKEQERKQQSLAQHEKGIIEEYKACCDYIKTTYDSAYLYSTKKSVHEFNERFGTGFNIKQLKSFVDSVKSDRECLEVFKANLETTT